MHGASRPALRLGAVGVFVAGLAALTLLWQQGRAGATAFSPQVAAVFDKGELKVGVGLSGDGKQPLTGTLLVELLDSGGRTISRIEKEVRQDAAHGQYAVNFATGVAKADQLGIRVSLGKEKHETKVAKALLLKAHETSLIAGAEYAAGSSVALRCGVHGVQSLTETVPLPGSEIKIQLKDNKGKTHDLYAGKVGADGLANVEFEMPSLEAGQYDLEITTRSALGEETLKRQIRLKADAKILLVSDKPIYQPGQLMHLRALALRSFDQKPVGDKDMLFEIEDSKGNKIYKKTLKTNEFGVASVDFQLADEVNMGDYHVRAVIGEARSDKTVNVKRYVLPKFKVNVTADKTFYLPKETIKAELQSDYFFGKAVAKAKIEVTASTFDVAFRKFHDFKGETDENGHAKFEITLPDYFVGQPLQKGDAIVKLEVKVHDSADHTETITKSYTVSDQPIRVSLIAEGGKLVPGMENRIFAAAIYPDGSPAANAEIKVWHRKEAVPVPGGPGPRGGGVPPPKIAPAGAGIEPVVAIDDVQKGKDKEIAAPLATAKTNAAGLAEIKITPKNDQFRQGVHGPRDIETLGGKQIVFGPAIIFDVRAEAKDPKGNTAAANIELNSHPLGENVLLRLDKAVYQTGDIVNIDVRTSAGLPTAFVDVVRGGQIMLSRWLEVKDGKASQALDLPQSVYGSLEIHAYQMLSHGEIIRDSRVVYVQPKNDLKIDVQAEKQYAPGEDARIRFTVTDSAGKPTQAALGVIVVDEAVYALQEMQPGLEKVYFTLQEELLKPSVQIKFNEGLDNIVLQPVLPAPRQQVAEVLLTAVKLPAPQRWNVAPAVDRKQRAERQVAQIGSMVYWYAVDPNGKFQEYDKTEKRWAFRKDLLDELTKTRGMPPQWLEGVFGGKLSLDDLAKIEKTFTPEHLGKAVTAQRLNQVMWTVINHTNQNQAKFRKGDAWVLPSDVVDQAVAAQRLHAGYAKDAWGQSFKLVKRDKKIDKQFGNGQFDLYDLVSSGPDGKFGTKDDVTRDEAIALHFGGGMQQFWWANEERLDRLADQGGRDLQKRRGGFGDDILTRNGAQLERAAAGLGAPGGFGGGGFPPAPGAAAPKFAVPMAKDGPANRPTELKEDTKHASGPAQGGEAGGAAPITKVREYFPETMLWQPSLITDSKGVADLAVNFADSITTWRLSASANAKSGALGGMTVPLKVFQDFFVDIDLPVTLTHGDEVAFPVAIYNYLKEPQQLKIELEKEAWFELLDSEGLTRTLNVKPGDVTFVRYRIKANKIGHQPLTVKAHGSKKSDAVKRLVEVVPNGQRFEKVVTDRLTGKIKQTIEIPADAVADASKLFVRIYPGVMAQVVDGLDGMLRMPCGCFEQTSSSAYPNIMIVDYIKRNKIASPQMLLKAEQYLNVGYQRLLTFERPGGGFDWWGNGEPLVWLSAYGLQEFSDMSKVWPIDRGIIDRTQQFLMRKMDKDNTWSNIGATHGETIANMGNPKLLLTSYVVWSLLDSGMNKQQLAKSVDYIRANLKDADDNAYILALAANALAAYDPKDDSTLLALQKLDKLRKEIPEWKAANFPGRGTSLTYARGDGVTIETTALAAIAMARTGQFTASVNQALTFLVKAKEGNGTWGGTQATILALRALMAGMGASQQKEPAHFVISVNGKEAARGKVDADNADVMQAFDLKGLAPTGVNDIAIEVNGESNLMYQIVGRHFQPWKKEAAQEKSPIEIDVTYDRTKLSTSDLLHAKATLKYHGKTPTYMVMVDLGIAPGFNVDVGDFAEMVGKKQIQKFSITSRQVIMYLGDVKPGDVLTFEYSLKPRFPLRARTAPSVAYEYNTPANRAEAQPVELVVEDRK